MAGAHVKKASVGVAVEAAGDGAVGLRRTGLSASLRRLGWR